MINPGHKILTAWFELLNDNLSVPVYRTDVPVSETGNYVILRLESSSQSRTNSTDIHRPVIITEVVTKFPVMIDDSLATEIDSEIAVLLSTTPAKHNLPSQDDIEIVSVIRQNATYLSEDDGTNRYLRLITRNVHRVVELVN